MIEATCIACGKLLGRFATPAEYTEWRERNNECDCGASLAATLFTSYTKTGEKPRRKADEKSQEAAPEKVELQEDQPQEATQKEEQLTDSTKDIFKERRKPWR